MLKRRALVLAGALALAPAAALAGLTIWQLGAPQAITDGDLVPTAQGSTGSQPVGLTIGAIGDYLAGRTATLTHKTIDCVTAGVNTCTLPPAGGSAPGGTSGQIQVNSSGAFGGITNTQLTADCNLFGTSLSGCTPASGGGTTNFLRADGSWAAPPPGNAPGGSSGQVQTNNGSGSFAGLSNAQLTALCQLFGSSLSGCVPASGGGTTTFLRADGTFAVPSGGTASPGGANGNLQFNNNGAVGGSRGSFVVTAFGATGNGSTDDTSAIQAAINAAEALTGCGTVYFPPGQYLIHTGPLVINTNGCALIGLGGVGWNTSPRSGAVLIGDTAVDVLFADAGATGLKHEGPRIQNINFEATGAGLRVAKLLHIRGFMRDDIRGDAFDSGGWGIYMEGGGSDISDFEISPIWARNNVVAVECVGNGSGDCNGTVRGGEISVSQHGDVGVKCDAGGAQFGIYGVHFDGLIGGDDTPDVVTACNQTQIIGNHFEAGKPAVWVDQTAGGNNGRGTAIIGNQVNQDGSPNPIATITCAETSGSAGLTGCSSIAGIIVGDELHGSGIPDYTLSAPNQLAGGTYVASTPSGTTIPMTENATATNASVTITVRPPTYHWPHTPTHPIIAVGNAYASAPPSTALVDGQ